LVTLTDDQAARKDLKFVYELPKTVEEVAALISERGEEEKLIVL
jgi:hypothetical protein